MFNVEKAVRERYSVRNYDNKRKLTQEIRDKITSYAATLDNPLGPNIRIQWVEKSASSKGEKLGTYGIIKGAELYLGVTMPDEEYAPEALGYDFEKIVLYAQSLGIGTCWLGGTFNRSGFTKAMDIKENELFPILSPIGYPAKKLSLTERIMRKAVKADDRLPWKDMFFLHDFNTSLSEGTAGDLNYPLEMVRLAPSAVNRQPWRVVICDDRVHFYEKHFSPVEPGSVDMHRIDLGIAICHFHMAAEEQGMSGHFERKDPCIDFDENLTYIATWVRK